jgi:hypothetical protein
MKNNGRRSKRPSPPPIDHSDIRQIAKELGLHEVHFAPLVDQAVKVTLAVTLQRESTMFPFVRQLLAFIAQRCPVSFDTVCQQFGCATDNSRRALGEVLDTLHAVGEVDLSSRHPSTCLINRAKTRQLDKVETAVDVQHSCFLPRVSRFIAKSALLSEAEVRQVVGNHAIRLADVESLYKPDVAKRAVVEAASRGGPNRKRQVFEPSVRNETLQRAGLLETHSRVLGVSVRRYNDRPDAYALVRFYLYKTTPDDTGWGIMARRYGAKLPEPAYGLYLTKHCRNHPDTLMQMETRRVFP